jgi:hypothetical protein
MKDQLFFATTKDARGANHLATQGGSVIASITDELEWVRFAAPAARLPLLTRALQKDLSKENKYSILERKMGALQKEMERHKTEMTGKVADLERANAGIEREVADLRLVNQALVTSEPSSVEDGSNP